MRGKPYISDEIELKERIIPAHAGKTASSSVSAATLEDHPRPCGENWLIAKLFFRAVGSSPPMRGKRTGVKVHRLDHGIIPAHAGKTCWRLQGYTDEEDHPRPCGENLVFNYLTFTISGSSPPMRGKQEPVPKIRSSNGIIPAHAGKTTNPGSNLCAD